MAEIDHVCGGIAARQLPQHIAHRIEHAAPHPSSVAAEDAIPRDAIMERGTSSVALCMWKWSDQRLIAIVKPNPLA